MANGGYTGKILRVDLTTQEISTIDTSKYEQWGGGNGIGAALFWDLIPDRTLVDGFDPRNIVIMMTSPLSGTMVPYCSARTEVMGLAPQGYPVNWFTRSNFGGRFSPQLKYAGWDGIVVEGESAEPVWLKIENDNVTIESAADLWGLDTWETQETIWRKTTDYTRYGEWLDVGGVPSTNLPAIVVIGPAGENLSSIASLIHEKGSSAGQGGFGGVFGKKKLKAISVIGDGSVKIADPETLWNVRQHIRTEVNWPVKASTPAGRSSSCFACPNACRFVKADNVGNDAMCIESLYATDKVSYGSNDALKIGDLMQKYGVNAADLFWTFMYIHAQMYSGGEYLNSLYDQGILGSGKEIECYPLPGEVEKWGSLEWYDSLVRAISYRQGIGDDLADGVFRAAEKWGRLEEDLANGNLRYPQWGYSFHHTLPTAEWIYGSVFGDRDINEHTYFGMFNEPLASIDAETLVEMTSQKTVPFTGDPLMFNYQWQGADGSNMDLALEEGIYSSHFAKFVAYHRRHTRFFRQSLGYCDFSRLPRYLIATASAGDNWGFSDNAEVEMFNAVTGNDWTTEDCMKVGQRIWNLERALWVLEGRHRDAEVPSEFMFKPPLSTGINCNKILPVKNRDGAWIADANLDGMFLDKDGFEAFKDHYYALEGWDIATGWPTRANLEELGLKDAADALEAADRLGNPS